MNNKLLSGLVIATILALAAWAAVSKGLLPGGKGTGQDAQIDGAAAVHLTEANFASTVSDSQQPVLVDFWAEWCPPCRKMTPVIDGLAGEMEGRAVVAKLNVDDAPKIAGQYNVSSIPTIIIFKDGKEVDRVVGVHSQAELAKKLAGLAG